MSTALRKNMLVYFIGKIIPALSVLFLMYYGVKKLGEKQYGEYNLIFNSVSVVITLFIGWIQQSMLRFNGSHLSQSGNRAEFLWLTLLFSLMASMIVFFLLKVYFASPLNDCLLITVYTFLLSCITVYLTYCQSVFRSSEYAFIESGYYLVTIVSVFIMGTCVITLSYINFYAGWIISGTVIVLYILLRNVKLINGAIKPHISTGFFNAMFRFGFVISAWLFIAALFNVTDRFIIKYYLGYESVGEYSVIYDFIYRVSSFACLPALLSIHPAVTKAWNEENKSYVVVELKKGLKIIALILLAELIGFGVLGNYIFKYFFHLNGESYLTLIIPLVISSMLWQAALLIHKPLELLLSQHQMIVGIIISIISNIILNILLIPVFGYKVAAITTLASTLIYIFYIFIKTPKNFWSHAA